MDMHIPSPLDMIMDIALLEVLWEVLVVMLVVLPLPLLLLLLLLLLLMFIPLIIFMPAILILSDACRLVA